MTLADEAQCLPLGIVSALDGRELAAIHNSRLMLKSGILPARMKFAPRSLKISQGLWHANLHSISLTESNEYGRRVVTKCCAMSNQLGSPTLFLMFTMNHFWSDFQALQRSAEPYADSAMAAVIFRSHVNALMKFIQSRKNLGSVLAFGPRIEYSQGGLPQAHILWWTNDGLPHAHVLF